MLIFLLTYQTELNNFYGTFRNILLKKKKSNQNSQKKKFVESYRHTNTSIISSLNCLNKCKQITDEYFQNIRN